MADSVSWALAKAKGESPGRRVGHSLDLVKGSFGGATWVLIWGKGSTIYHNDALALRARDMVWTKPKLHGKIVVPRWRHASQGRLSNYSVARQSRRSKGYADKRCTPMQS